MFRRLMPADYPGHLDVSVEDLNNVYLVVDFHQGVFSQKCHDPDCKGLRNYHGNLSWNIFVHMDVNIKSIQCETDRQQSGTALVSVCCQAGKLH